jgi:hypothetical protein
MAYPFACQTPFYHLGPRAAEMLSPGDPEGRIAARRRRAMEFSESALPHLLEVDAVHIRFVTAERAEGGYRMLGWIPQYHGIWRKLSEVGLPFRPDGYVTYTKDSVVFHSFVEIDRGTERGSILGNKLYVYDEYAESGGFEQHFGASRFRVLFVAGSMRRAGQLLRAMARYQRDLFWVTTAREFFTEPLFDPHWRTPSTDVALALDTPL